MGIIRLTLKVSSEFSDVADSVKNQMLCFMVDSVLRDHRKHFRVDSIDIMLHLISKRPRLATVRHCRND